MRNDFKLSATSRKDVGKGASRRLRHSGVVPAIVYGAGKTPTSICLDHNAVLRALENEAFYSHILSLELDGKSEKVILRDMQRHPYLPRLLHLDLQRISASEKLTMRVPLHFRGAEMAPGVKQAGGLISHLMSEIEIRCLPADLPEFIEADLSKLELNQALHLSQLVLPKGVEIVELMHGEDKPVATVYIPRAVVEEVATPVTQIAGEAEVAVGAEGDAKGEAKAGAASGKGSVAEKEGK
jgi:large subunit ribosomal protein L25